MRVLMGSDKIGLHLKNQVRDYLLELGYEVTDKTETGAEDFVESTLAVITGLSQGEGELGILYDASGTGSFMAANKVKGVISAQITDEHSAKMTRDHNCTQIITMGSDVVGEKLAKSCAIAFLKASYSGGRHQIRVDMLNKML